MLGVPAARDAIAIANLTTHDPVRGDCDERCLVLQPGDHSFVRHASCVYYKRARLRSLAEIKEAEGRGDLLMRRPLGARLLRRIQEGALAAPATRREVREAVRETLRRRR